MFLSFHPWALTLSMVQWNRWCVGSCGCGCWLVVGVARLFASSDSDSLSAPPSSTFSSPLSFPSPLPLPPPSLPSRSSPYLYSLPSPPPFLSPLPFPPSRVWGPDLPSIPHRQAGAGSVDQSLDRDHLAYYDLAHERQQRACELVCEHHALIITRTSERNSILSDGWVWVYNTVATIQEGL